MTTFAHNPYYYSPQGYYLPSYSVEPASAAYPPEAVPQLWCCWCNEKTTIPTEQYCSRRCAWTAAGKCPQCGRKHAEGSVYCGPSCAREATHANWCPNCAVRQLASSKSQCGACGYVPAIPLRAATKAEAHRLLDPTEKEYKALQKQWAQGNTTGRQILAIIRVGQAASQRRGYLSYRAQVDVVVQSSGSAKYMHGGEGNELRRFYPTTYTCEFGSRSGFAACQDPSCTVCSVLQYGPSGASMGYSDAGRTMEASQPNAVGVTAMFVCRVVVGSAYHSPYPTASTPEGHHSTVVTYQPAESAAPKPTPRNQFFPAVVDDAIIVHRQDAVDPVYLILCA